MTGGADLGSTTGSPNPTGTTGGAGPAGTTGGAEPTGTNRGAGRRDSLTSAQRAALDHVTAVGDKGRQRALERLGDLPDLAELIAAVRVHGRVTLNFHPDRLLADGRTVAQSMAADGRYRGQFETGISNGGLFAYPGGHRDRWEEALFGGAYQAAGVLPADRPRYGGLNLLDHPDGACPRFGSCHVRLKPSVNPRTTFTVGDSHLGPADVGTLDAFECVLAGLVERARETGVTLGRPGLDPLLALRGLAARPPVGRSGPAVAEQPGQALAEQPGRAPAEQPGLAPAEQPGLAPAVPFGRALDDYLEAQVHGPIDLATDAEALVLDPSFRGTPSGELLADLARRAGLALEWHAGFELTPAEVGPDFRGPAIPPLAAHICEVYAGPRGTFDAELIGRAAAAMLRDPQDWTSWGTPDELLQYVKQLWHTLVHTGRPYLGR